MPHLKCEPCSGRRIARLGARDQGGDLCPDCGSLLEPVDEAGSHDPSAAQLRDLIGRRFAAWADTQPD